MKNRIHIFTGHFGSGKTEVALNFALQEKKKGEDVVIVDLDIVNPYFRTNDARNVLMKNGIKVVAIIMRRQMLICRQCRLIF